MIKKKIRRFAHSVARATGRGPTRAAFCATALLLGNTPAIAQAARDFAPNLIEVASPSTDQTAKDKPRAQPETIEPIEAARRASRRYGGRVLNVVLEDGPGGPYYQVRLLDGGRMRVVRVEARR